MQGRPGKPVTLQTLSLTALWGDFRRKVVARKFVQDVGILTIANFVVAGLNFLQGILVARWLGPELYGVAALVMSYPSLVYAVFDARSMQASVKYLSEYHALGERNGALAMSLLGYAVDFAVACLTFLVLALTARMVAANIVHDPAVAGLMILYGAALVPHALVGTSNAILATLGRFPFIASIQIVTTVFRTVLLVGLVLGDWQVVGVVWAHAVAATTTGLLYGAVTWVLIRRTWGGSIFQGKMKDLKGRRREIFAFFAYNDLNTLVGMIPRHLDLVVLGYFRGPTEVGYYKLAKSMSRVTGYLMAPLRSVTYAELARLSGLGHRRAFSQKVRKVALWIGFPLGLIVLLAAGFMPVVLPLLVGEIYIPAVRATQLLFIGSAILLACFWLHPVYLAKGYIRQAFIIGSSVTVGFALIFPLVIWEWGYIGASAWMLARSVVMKGVSGFWLWKRADKKEQHGTTIEINKQKRMIEVTDERLAETVVQTKDLSVP
jgi:O-antigen/teichoic acid export membrane protein